jgi:hypothetical protein
MSCLRHWGLNNKEKNEDTNSEVGTAESSNAAALSFSFFPPFPKDKQGTLA